MLDLTVVQAIHEMTKGATMLKGGRGKRAKGKPHYRNFSLSQDLTYLQWESPKKEKEESIIHISQMGDLKHGFKSSSSHLHQESESLSFSIVYFDQPLQGKTLDFVCKDKQQYQIWTTGLEALIHGFNDKEAVWELMKRSKDLKGSHIDDKNKVDSGSWGSLKTPQQDEKLEACHIFTWGEGTKGMLGHGEDNEEHTPHIVHALLGWEIKMVACGTAHTIALTVDGTVYSWGSGNGGRLGQGHLRDRYSPIQVEGLSGKHVLEVACNEFHSAAVCSNGELYTWGKDSFRLGYHCTERRQTSPKLVEGLHGFDVAHVACGLNHTIGCTSDGRMFVFGDNEFGQLGVGDKVSHVMPIFPEVYELESVNVLNVACGKYHSAIATDIGTCWLWGLNDFGQLGNGDTSNKLLPTKLVLPSTEDAFVKTVSCGEKHSAVITKKGIMFSFGDNSFGQLGVRRQSETEMPFVNPVVVVLPIEERVVKLSCGGFHTALVTESGKLYTMGNGGGGRLGDGEDVTKFLPTFVESLSGKNVLSISCGAKHSACAVAPSNLKDEEHCMSCRQKVGGFRRKHQCKNCFGMFCNDCCSKKLMACKGYNNAVRVCTKCSVLLTNVKGIYV